MMKGGTGLEPLASWLSGDGQQFLDQLMQDCPDVLGVLDPELRIQYLNFTGPAFSRDQLIGKSVLDSLPPEFKASAERTYRKVLETGVADRFDTIYRSGDTVRLWDVRVGPIRKEGAIIGLIAISSNVTDQRLEQTVKDRFFALSLDLLVVWGTDGRFKRVNPAFCETLGYEEADVIGKPFTQFTHPDDVGKAQEVYESLCEGTPLTDFESRFRARDGKHLTFSWRGSADPVTGDLYAVARDITAQRTMEAQLRQAQKMEAVGQLAGGIAHDFNNLMQTVLANAELALEEISPPTVTEHLTEIEGAGQRAADLTKQLLAFSRRQSLRPVPVDLNRLLNSLMRMLRRLLPASIDLDLIPGHGISPVVADPSQLEQVIVNLCVNARDAIPGSGKITIETENVLVNGRYRESHPWARPGRYILLSVTDTGVGMTTEVKERAFEPFFTTKAAHHGTGLGLSTVYGIVRQHDGMVHVYSEPDHGTTFKLYLPSKERLASEVGDKRESLPARGAETILVVEDEERVRRALVRVLQRAGYQVLEAEDGVEAIRVLRHGESSVHLAILDVVMPELSGPETWTQLHALDPALRVLFASGYADDRFQRLLPKGAGVLEKPFRSEELLRRVRAVLDA